MTRRALTYFPHDLGYDFGDAQHLPIVPDIEGPDPDDLQPDIPSPSVNPVNPINSVKNSEEEKP